jgi:hypothetical protein
MGSLARTAWTDLASAGGSWGRATGRAGLSEEAGEAFEAATEEAEGVGAAAARLRGRVRESVKAKAKVTIFFIERSSTA